MEFLVSTRLDIESALKNLELEDREIVTMRINANMKFREIAELTKKPLGTVLWRYQRAIGRLREILSGGES
jgi:RNA polymerase sigma-70 factor (ECF subfamily)